MTSYSRFRDKRERDGCRFESVSGLTTKIARNHFGGPRKAPSSGAVSSYAKVSIVAKAIKIFFGGTRAILTGLINLRKIGQRLGFRSSIFRKWINLQRESLKNGGVHRQGHDSRHDLHAGRYPRKNLCRKVQFSSKSQGFIRFVSRCSWKCGLPTFPNDLQFCRLPEYDRRGGLPNRVRVAGHFSLSTEIQISPTLTESNPER